MHSEILYRQKEWIITRSESLKEWRDKNLNHIIDPTNWQR